MEIVISILIASVISLGISIYFHGMSKKDNAMERVKAYANARTKDMEESFKQLENHFNILVAEFDSRQTQANAAVKLLSQQNDEFAQKINNLDASIKAVQNIEAQINGYSNLLNDLNEMTAQVEENLLRIQKESVIVNKLNDRLDKQKQTVDSIDKKIPQISEHFSQENEEQLKAVGTTLLDEYKNYADKIAAEIKKSQTDAEAALDKIKQQIQEAYNQAAAKAENLENTAFDHLSQQATERSERYISELKAQNDELDTKITQTFKESETKLVTDIKSELTKMNDKFEQSIQKLHEKYNSQLESVSGKNEGIITKLEAQFNADFTRIDQKCKSDFEKISQRYEENYGNLSQKYDTDYQSLSEKYDEAVAKISQKYDSQLGSIGAKGDKEISDIEQRIMNDIERLKNEYSKAFDTATSVNNKKINEFNANFVNEHQKLKDEFEQAIQRIAQESTGKIEGFENTVNQEITSFTDECREQINSFQNEYNQNLTEFKDSIGSRLTDVENEYENKTAALESNISDLTERYETQEEGLQKVFSNRLEALDEDYKQKIAEIRMNLEDSLKKCQETTEFLKHDVDGNSQSLQTIQSELDEEIKAMQERYASLYRDALASADQKEKDALESFNSAVQEKVDEYEGLIQQKIDSLQESITEKIRNVSLQTSNSIHDAETAIADLQKECSAANQRAQELEPELDAKVKSIEKEIEDFKTDAEIKLNNMNKYISDTVKRSVAESEQTHLNILEGIDEQLCSYKKDIEHKLTQIQNSGADVDTLEKSLRSAMQEVQTRVLGDFDSFTKDQQKRHEEFSAQIKQDSESIEIRLHEIDNSLDELKTTATGSMSAKLSDFEKTFNDNILTTNNEIESTLSGWKVEMDTKLTSISSTYEASRKEIEQHYQEELKNGLASVQARTVDQYDKLAEAVEKTKTTMEKNIFDIQETIGDFQEETRNKISKLSTETDKELKTELDKTTSLVQANLNRVQEELLADLKSFEDSLRERQESSTSSIDAALAEFNTWKQQLRSQLDGANSVFKEELNAFENNAKDNLEETRQKVNQDMLTYAASIQDQQNELNDKIESLQNKTEASVKEYEERSEQILTQLQETYTQMLTDTEDRVRAQSSDSAQKVEQLKKDIQTASEQNRANQAEFVLKMQNDANDMQFRMSELSKELQTIRANIQLFERADAMKRQLDDNMEDLNNRFEKLDQFTDTAEDLTKQYSSIVRLNDEMKRKLEEIEQQKQRVVTLEQKFGQMFALSNTIDERIQSLNTTSDDIGTMEVAVRDYRDKLDIVSQQYERLEKKDEVINRVLKDVDTSFANLKNMEQRIADCERQVTSMPNEIKSVQANIDRLLQNGPKITEAAAKLQNLDSVLTETEKRIDDLNSANSGIKRMQLEIEQGRREINSKIDTLHQITKEEVGKKGSAPNKSISPQERKSIRDLKRSGWTNDELARRFKRTPTEIDLILDLPEE